MTQGVLPFQYDVEKKAGGMTALAGLPLHLELADFMGLPRLIAKQVRVFHVASAVPAYTD